MIVTVTRAQEKINYSRGIGKRMRIKKVSNLFNSTNQQNPTTDKAKAKSRQYSNEPGTKQQNHRK
jgi:hypothetical protein